MSSAESQEPSGCRLDGEAVCVGGVFPQRFGSCSHLRHRNDRLSDRSPTTSAARYWPSERVALVSFPVDVIAQKEDSDEPHGGQSIWIRFLDGSDSLPEPGAALGDFTIPGILVRRIRRSTASATTTSAASCVPDREFL